MGGLLTFRVGNFDTTAEREQFRFLCEQLKAHYEDSNEFCVFAGNYNIGCELDALFIKKDAIISIEFKNYGGNVVANENGEWTYNGKIIKGGSRKTVLQQARINHSTVKKELKVLGVEKNMLGDKWDSNPASAYVGALLNHFQENSAFDLFAIENDVLSSFAAFCQKGDNIDRLVEYLVQVGFCNYKLAYGIYGATRGFTSLPKTFTSVLINGNKDYYQSFASNVWRMLNGIEIKDAVLPKASNSTSVIVESQLGSKIIENQNNVESKVVKQQKVVEAVNKAVKLENIVQSPKAFMYIFSSFSRITTTKAYKALDAVNFAGDEGSYTPEQFRSKIYSIVGKEGLKTQKENIDKAIELESKRQDPEAFLSILDNFLKPTDAAYKKIEKLISSIKSLNTTSYPQPQGNNVISQDGVEKRNLKPIHPTSSKFVEDANVNYFILSRNYLPIKMRETLSRKVITFQKGYAPGGKYYSNPLGNPIDNRSTIDHFKHWCFYDKGGYPPIVEGTYENKQYFEQLMQDLFNRYANR